MNYKLYLAAFASMMVSVLMSKVATVHASIDNTDKLNPVEKSLLDNLTTQAVNLASTEITNHIASLVAPAVTAPVIPTVTVK